MKEEDKNKTVQQDSMPCVKFSDISKMLESGAVEMDEPGCIVVVNKERIVGRAETDGLPSRHKLNVVFQLLMGGLAKLAREAVLYDPEALGTIAKWWGRNGRDGKRDSVLEGILRDL